MLGGDVMYQNELHPRRNFMFFCFWGHICGAFAPVALSLFDDELPRDLVDPMRSKAATAKQTVRALIRLPV